MWYRKFNKIKFPLRTWKSAGAFQEREGSFLLWKGDRELHIRAARRWTCSHLGIIEDSGAALWEGTAKWGGEKPAVVAAGGNRRQPVIPETLRVSAWQIRHGGQ